VPALTSGVSSISSLFSSIFSPAKPAALTPAQIAAGVKPPTSSTGTSTMLILGVAGLAAFLLLKRRRR
jgi:LPXTG-motif cell wall-anchored protein